jgi:hypothetical protein
MQVDDLIYVGSTSKTLTERFNRHIYAHNCYFKKGIKTTEADRLFEYSNNNDNQEVKISLLYEGVHTKKEIEILESSYIIQLNAINKLRYLRLSKQEKNILEYQKRKDNANRKEYQKNYLTNYYKTKSQNKIICDVCKGTYTEFTKKVHFKTKKHLALCADQLAELNH